MVEAERVENFVLHRASEQAALRLQRDRLSSSLATNVGPTPGGQEGRCYRNLTLCELSQARR